MSESPSHESFLRRVNAGTESGAEKLDREFRSQLEALAAQGMDRRLSRRESPEDIVQSVLRTVFRRTAEGQLQFEHPGQLWRLLETVTRHKILKHAEYHRAKKRTPAAEEEQDADALLARTPTAEQEAVAIQADDKNADAYFYRGVAYAGKKEADSAAENFKQALERREDVFTAHLQLARLYCEKGQPDDLRQAVEFASRAVRLKDRSAEAQRWLAKAYLGRQQYPEAANALKAMLDLEPASRPEVLPRLTEALRQQAKGFAEASEWTQALQLLTEALGYDPGNPALLLLRAEYASAQGDLDSADRDYERVTQLGSAPDERDTLRSKLGEIHLRRARDLEDSGDAMAIVVHLAKAVAYRPEWRSKLSLQIAAFYRYLGGTFEMSRVYDDAAEYYEKAAEWTSADTEGDQPPGDTQLIKERRSQADRDREKAQQLRNRAGHGTNVSGELVE